MSGIILHHYPTSPYGEMVRLALGLKGLAWESVEQSNIMPRPYLTPLTGGYRRIPVMQVGADIFCDTQMILRAIDRLYPERPLTPPGQEGLAWALRGWAERTWFQMSVAVIFGAIGDNVPEAFVKDREELSGRPFDTQALKAAAPLMADQWRANAMMVEQRLAAGGPFVLGDQAGLADLACYLNIWFLGSFLAPVYDQLTADMPSLAAWRARMAALGHGQPAPLSQEAAFARAAAAAPMPVLASNPVERQGFKPGDAVIVSADDYGRHPVSGTIRHITPLEIAIDRDAEGAGAVAVHFPRAGFFVMRAS